MFSVWFSSNARRQKSQHIIFNIQKYFDNLLTTKINEYHGPIVQKFETLEKIFLVANL